MPRAAGDKATAAKAIARKRHAAKAQDGSAAAAPAARLYGGRAVATPQQRGASARARAEVEPPGGLAKRMFGAPPGVSAAKASAASSAEAAAVAGLRMHGEVLAVFAGEKRGGAPTWRDACEVAEKKVTELYPELLAVFQILFQSACIREADQEHIRDRSYSVAELQGRSVEGASSETDLASKLEQLRNEGELGLVRDALCAVLAALSSRKDMSWVEAYDEEKPVRGYFAHALASPHTALRLAFVTSPSGLPRPASLLVTSRVPLKDALDGTDSGGPLQHLPPESCLGGVASDRFELGIQELEVSEELGAFGSMTEERALAREVVAEPALRTLLLSQTEVLVVESYVALAPREVCMAEGLSEIIQAEFTALLQRAKADGVAVVFQLGSHNPHLLARKVYMRPCFSAHGLRFGYLRWRSGPDVPWGREQPWVNRVCLGVQLP